MQVFVEKHRKATDDSLHHLMTTVILESLKQSREVPMLL